MADKKGKVISTQFDPKNREVNLLKHGTQYKVYKAGTGFASPWLDKHEEAMRLFTDQCADSQNHAAEYCPQSDSPQTTAKTKAKAAKPAAKTAKKVAPKKATKARKPTTAKKPATRQPAPGNRTNPAPGNTPVMAVNTDAEGAD